MKASFNENKSLFSLLGVLVFVILGALYYYIILPKSDEETSMTMAIESLENETNQLQQEIYALSVVEDETMDNYELRKKLPKKRDVNILLLSLQEAELVSEAKIMSISFNDYDGLVSESNIEPKTEEESTEEAEAEAEEAEENVDAGTEADTEADTDTVVEEENADKDIPHTQIDIELLPEQLKLLSLSLEIIVQDYEHLLTFIKEVEAVERSIRIDGVSFSQIGEEGFATEDLDESIVVTIQLTTFYSEEVGS